MATESLMRAHSNLLKWLAAAIAFAGVDLYLLDCLTMCFQFKMVMKSYFAFTASISTGVVAISLVLDEMVLKLSYGQMFSVAQKALELQIMLPRGL
jgi:hypothetical protein